MSEMFPEPSIFGPDGPLDTLIEEGRRAMALENATRIYAGRERAGRVPSLGTEYAANEVVAIAKRFATYLRSGE